MNKNVPALWTKVYYEETVVILSKWLSWQLSSLLSNKYLFIDNQQYVTCYVSHLGWDSALAVSVIDVDYVKGDL